jgi:peptidoglycan/LPS O-acetylase OafA/YrhL
VSAAAPAPRYYAHVDGLRAIAVLGVIAYHLWPAWLPGGFIGVDVFFVISGYVVSASLLAAPAAGFGRFAAAFYARRLRRIAPALVACLLLTGVASALLIPPAWLSQTSDRTGLMAFVGLGNLVLAAAEGDYFSPRTEYNPYAHTWSLGVEEQFYLLFPLLFFGWVRGGTMRRVASSATCLLALASLACAWHWAGQGAGAAAFYLLPSRFWQLAAGMLLFQWLTRRESMPAAAGSATAWRAPLGWASLAAILLGLVLARPGRTPWPDGVLPVLGTLGVLALLHPAGQRGRLGRWLASAPMVGIGKLSYSLYLWHWPVFVLCRWTIGLESAGAQVLALATAVLLAIGSYFAVERPLRRTRRGSGWPPLAFVGVALMLVVASGWAFHGLYKARPALSLSNVVREGHDWYPEETVRDSSGRGCEVRRESRDASPERRWTWRRSGCAAAGATVRRVFVLGDSHALAYGPMLQHLVLASGDEVHLFHRTGCPYLELARDPATDPQACRDATQRFLHEIEAQARAGDVLFLPSLRLPRLAEQWQAALAPPVPSASGRDRAEAEGLRQLAPFAARGVRVVFEAPKPVLPAPPYRCTDRFNAGNPVCAGGLSIARARIESMRAEVLAGYARLQAGLPGASVWDPLPELCSAATCAAFRAGRPLYFDGDHLSGHGNRVLVPSFVAHLESLRHDAPSRGWD